MCAFMIAGGRAICYPSRSGQSTLTNQNMNAPTTKHDVNKLVAMYIIAIGTSGRPNSHVWMQVDKEMSNLDLHQNLVDALIASKVIKQSNWFLSLTEKGLELHKKLVEIYLPNVVEDLRSKQSPC